MADRTRNDDLPGTFKAFITKFPALGEAHEDVARAVESYGPLDAKTRELIKIGISIGAGLETAGAAGISSSVCSSSATSSELGRTGSPTEQKLCELFIQHM